MRRMRTANHGSVSRSACSRSVSCCYVLLQSSSCRHRPPVPVLCGLARSGSPDVGLALVPLPICSPGLARVAFDGVCGVGIAGEQLDTDFRTVNWGEMTARSEEHTSELQSL